MKFVSNEAKIEYIPEDHELGKMPIGKLLLKMSVPMMISMFMLAFYNVVDSIFVSRVSEAALSALSLSYPVQFLMVALNVGTNVGVTALISRSLGEKKFEKASEFARHGLFLAIVYFVVFFLLGIFFTESFFNLIANDPAIKKEGVDYLSIILIFSFGFFICTSFEKMMQATGRSIGSMITQLTGAILNIILDPIMIFGLCGFPAMGTKGAAIATVIGQIVSAIVGYILNRTTNKDLKLNFFKIKLQKNMFAEIYRIGIPSIIMQSVGSFMIMGLNAILIVFPSAVAVLGVYYKIQSFIFMPLIGLNNGMVPIVSYNYGAHNKDRIVEVLKKAISIGLIIMICGALILIIFPGQILSLFAASETMLAAGKKAFRIIAIHYPFATFSILLGSVMQATKKELYSLVPSLTRQLIVLLPVAFVLSKIIGSTGVWLAFPIAEIFSSTLTFILFKKTYDEQIATL